MVIFRRKSTWSWRKDFLFLLSMCMPSSFHLWSQTTALVWFEKFNSVVIVVGFLQSVRDHAMLVHLSPRGCTIHLIFVVDMIIMVNVPAHIQFVEVSFWWQFEMKNLGPLWYFLGIDVAYILGNICCPNRNTSLIWYHMLFCQMMLQLILLCSFTKC